MAKHIPTKKQMESAGSKARSKNRPIQGPNTSPPVTYEAPLEALREHGITEWQRVATIQNTLSEGGEHWLTASDLGVLLAYCVAFDNFVAACRAVQGWYEARPNHSDTDASDDLEALIGRQERRAKRMEAAANVVQLTPRARQRMNIVMYNDFRAPQNDEDAKLVYAG